MAALRSELSNGETELLFLAGHAFAARHAERACFPDDMCLCMVDGEASLAARAAIGSLAHLREADFFAAANAMLGCNLFGHYCFEGTCENPACVKPPLPLNKGNLGGKNPLALYVQELFNTRSNATTADLAAVDAYADAHKNILVRYVALTTPGGLHDLVTRQGSKYVLASDTDGGPRRFADFCMDDRPTYSAIHSRAKSMRDIEATNATKIMYDSMANRQYRADAVVITPEEAVEKSGSEDEDGGDSPQRKRPKREKQSKLCSLRTVGTAEVCQKMGESSHLWTNDKPKANSIALQKSAAQTTLLLPRAQQLPDYYFRCVRDMSYQPDERASPCGGVGALAVAIRSAHRGVPPGGLLIVPSGRVVGLEQLPPLVDYLREGARYNTYAGPIALEKQLERAIPYVRVEQSAAVITATPLETRANAAPLIDFFGNVIQPSVLISFTSPGNFVTHPQPGQVLATVREISCGLDKALAELRKEPKGVKDPLDYICEQYEGQTMHELAKCGKAGAVCARLAAFLWAPTDTQLCDRLAEARELRADLLSPGGISDDQLVHRCSLWVVEGKTRADVYKRRAICATVGVFFDVGGSGRWWPNTTLETPRGKPRPSPRDLPPFSPEDDATIGLLQVELPPPDCLIGLVRVPARSDRSLTLLIKGHSTYSFTDGNRFVAVEAVSALAGMRCSLVDGADWAVRHPPPSNWPAMSPSVGAVVTPPMRVLSNNLYYNPGWDVRGPKVTHRGDLVVQCPDGKEVCLVYRVLRSTAQTTNRGDSRAASGGQPVFWECAERRAANAPDPAYLRKPDRQGTRPAVEGLVVGDFPPNVCAPDFTQLWPAATAAYPRCGMAALEPGDEVILSAHPVGAHYEATHAVLMGTGKPLCPAEPPPPCPPFKVVPSPATARPPAGGRVAVPHHGNVVRCVYDLQCDASNPVCDGLNALLNVVAFILCLGRQGKVILLLRSLQGTGKTMLMDILRCFLCGDNVSRRIQDLGKQMEEKFFCELVNALAVFSEEFDISKVANPTTKATVDDAAINFCVKYVQGMRNVDNWATFLGTLNPSEQGEKLEELDERRAIVIDGAAALQPVGAGRCAGGHAGGEYFQQIVALRCNPYAIGGLYNFLVLQYCPVDNLQAFAGKDKAPMMRAIRYGTDKLLQWQQFAVFLASLPDNMSPRGWKRLSKGQAAPPLADEGVVHWYDVNKQHANNFPDFGSAHDLDIIKELGFAKGLVLTKKQLTKFVQEWYRSEHLHKTANTYNENAVAGAIVADLAKHGAVAAGKAIYQQKVSEVLNKLGVVVAGGGGAWFDEATDRQVV